MLDASALLSLLLGEPGRERGEAAVDDACMSTVNLTEVYARLARDGHDLAGVLARLDVLPVEWVAFSDVHAAKPASSGRAPGTRVCPSAIGRVSRSRSSEGCRC